MLNRKDYSVKQPEWVTGTALQYLVDAKRGDRIGRILAAKTQDTCFSDYDREKLFRSQAEKKADFVHSMSYGRAVGYISRTAEKQLYNGSTYNRKPSNGYVSPWEIAYALASEEEQERMDIERDYSLYRPNKGLQFYQFETIGSRLTKMEQAPEKGCRSDNGNHTMSKLTKQKVKEKMLALYRACSGRKGYRSGVVDFTLCTLTFIAPVGDEEGMDCLGLFLNALRDRYGNMSYVSVTERQQNGNIHFHILFDMRFPISYINSLWVKQQIGQGIRNWESELKLYEDHRTTFENLHTEGKWHLVHEYLNPVDIRKVKTIDGVSAYLTNYVTKNTGSYKCAAWSCSRKVSKLFTSKLIDKKTFDKTGDPKRNCIVNKKTGELYTNTTYYGEYCTINTIYNKTYYRRYLEDLELINKYLLKIEIPPDREWIQQLIRVDNEEYRRQFLADQVICN